MLRSQVRIPTWDYDIDRSELEITCRYLNSRAPGGSCAAYDISPKSEPALELHSRGAPSVEAHHLVSGPNTGRGRRKIIIKNRRCQFKWFCSFRRAVYETCLAACLLNLLHVKIFL